MKSILVFFGGESPEHDISVITGVFAVNSINGEKFNAIPVYIAKNGEWFSGERLKDIRFYKKPNLKLLKTVSLLAGDNRLYLKNKNTLKPLAAVSGALNCMHGGYGEDGSLSGLLSVCKIPIAFSDAFASALAMDKSFTKIALKGIDVEFVEGITVSRRDYYRSREDIAVEISAKIGFPVIVKPCSTGSSIGIRTAEGFVELERAFETAFRYDEKVVVERFLNGAVEINCAAYKSGEKIIVSECEKPVPRGKFLSFEDKYAGSKGGEKREFPAKISDKKAQKIKALTAKIYTELSFSGIVRMDFLIYNNKVYLNEINSVPGSLAYYLFCNRIADFSKVLTEVIEEGFIKEFSKRSVEKEFISNVLSQEIKGVKK